MSIDTTDPYPHLRQPIQIAGCTVRNRIGRTAHGSNLLGFDGTMTEEFIAYQEARAKGGVGLSIIELMSIHPSGAATIPGWLKLWDPECLPGLEQFSARMHQHGMKIFQQLWHGGVNAPGGNGGPSWSSSTVADPVTGRVPISMTKAMIDEVVEGFASCAARCEEGGYDGVEIHAAHSYLVHQFLTPVYNRRTDEYGGSLENRMRFMVEVLEATRAAVSPGFPVGVRLSAIDLAPNGMEPDDVAVVAKRLEELGLIDFADVSLSTYHNMPKFLSAMFDPHGYELPTSRPVTAAVTVPTMVTGRIMTLAEAETVVADGTADMVSMVRATIADPELVNKSFGGYADRVRPCIGCNQGCIGYLFSGLPVCCTVNPEAGRETSYPAADPVDAPLDVLVVGGGPAGMEIAHAAAKAGHRVILHESGDALGGQIRSASHAKLRSELGVITDWLADELPRVGVDVRLGSDVTVDTVLADAPDVVFVATGSHRVTDGFQRLRPELVPAGLHLPHVMSADQLLDGESPQARHAVVFDDRWDAEAASVAETLLDQGTAVSFATSAPTLAPMTEVTLQREPFLARLTADERFRLHIRQSVTGITETSVELTGLDDDTPVDVPADLVVLVNRPLSERDLHGDLLAAGVDARLIGDALEATDLVHAIHTARAAAVALGAA